eukprot:11197801-Lingulodinium_polyedra.AAC.1
MFHQRGVKLAAENALAQQDGENLGGGRSVFWQATPPLLVSPPPVDALLETELRRHNRGAVVGSPLPR